MSPVRRAAAALTGPSRELLVTIQQIHREAGEPSMRDIARLAELSHDTVHRVLVGRSTCPTWRSLSRVVRALGGDVEAVRRLWLATRRSMDGAPE
jgi:DNA-binding phage protein